ncbi:MAG: acetylglutamate kinase [Flavisolibacter sp.]
MDKLFIIKIGGQVIDDKQKCSSFLRAFASIKEKKILVHGGGTLATQMATRLGIPQNLIEGRRITDAETLKVITMTYAGYINKNLVSQLQSQGCNALGLSGADGNAIKAHKRIFNGIDYGLVGDIDEVNAPFFQILIAENLVPVMAALTHDGSGQLLNTNADTIAQEIAKALSSFYEVSLLYIFEKNGVLCKQDDENSVIPTINWTSYQELKKMKIIFGGMIPKLDNAFIALQRGVKKLMIGKAENLLDLLEGKSGTTLTHDQ